MKNGLILVVASVSVVLCFGQQGTRPAGPALPTAAATMAAQRAVLDQYCVTCHNDKTRRAGLSLENLDLSTAGDHPQLWEKVVRKLRAGVMPPPGIRRPSLAEYEGLRDWLEAEIDRRAAARGLDPGAVVLHRLNRTEYANVIRDLLDLGIDPAAMLPADDSARGFDNVAGSLTISPTLLEAYSIAAARIARMSVGDPEAVAQTLIATANAAGGKDNITVVYVEGEQFAASQRRRGLSPSIAKRAPIEPPPRNRTLPRHLIFAVAALAIGLAIGRTGLWLPFLQPNLQSPPSNTQIVRPTESIAAAIEKALPGSQILVEPGEYREQVVLKNGIRLMSRAPREATIRLPINLSDADSGPAVVATGLSKAELAGFRIVGDAATPLGVGIGVSNGELSINNVEISGAAKAGIDFGDGSSATLVGSAIHDNPGAAILIRAGANPRVSNNVFTRNGMSERAPGNVVIEAGGKPVFQDNVFVGLSPDSFVTLDELARVQLKDSNWFLPVREPVRPASEPKENG